MIYLSDFIIYFLLVNIILISILGFGVIVSKILDFRPLFDSTLSHYFILGLIFIGSISILINTIIPLSDYYSILIIFLGSIIFIGYYNKIFTNFRIFLLTILPISLLAIIISFYAGLSDDYDYHWLTILNYKNFELFQIEHERRVSYNSHWLFLNSIFFILNIKSSLYPLSALLFAIIQIDFFKILKKNLNHNQTIAIFTLFCLVFLFGVTNIFKDFGTDIPGAIISMFILLNMFMCIEKKHENKFNIVIYIILLINFVIMIKITNSLIYLYFLVFLFLFNFNIKKLFSIKIFIVFLPLALWIFQNINISGCIVWPISSLCIFNRELTYEELYLIESFAKGDRTVLMNTDGFAWITEWFTNHFKKIIETYLVFTIFLILPLIVFKIKNKNIKFLNKILENFRIVEFKKSLFFIYPTILANLIWFFFYPAYRFGIFYNMVLIFFILYFFWFVMTDYKVFFKKVSFLLITIAMIFFIYENIIRFNWYHKKYGDIWPPIINDQIILKYD